ncbi:protein of unknown function DUF167 [Citrifermentans bemidjiense Bem]|jgi:uncharacterized protein (TIGR00251 family)|uniref:UPF0235 protein Gbem_1494 n=1 Tax=Citrifermentans bemidjiense (strain ATCC BAA-1014 / DSM 16622 / JCM 12645 / Bem) TaxID=404380 RepID=B5E7X6_CITBB|nr:DUF167 domain-containing protein [Citrifermentans bemidjiense]ACH38512.1 protein of unknown function DUF167 [Citrifermentans bemidjiense Bem]
MSEELRVTATPEGLLFTVHVQPRASRSEICGAKEGELRLRLTSPPVEDAANKQCVELIAKTLGVAKSKVSIKSGAKSRHKVVKVEGVDHDALLSLLKIQ